MHDEQAPPGRPLPEINDLSRPFFEAARRGVLKIMRCARCGTYQLPGRLACDVCLSGELEWVEASGRGAVFSFVVMHQKYHPAFETPYNVAVVELEEGPRLVTNVVGVQDEDLRVGMVVEAEFEEVSEEVALPVFRPAGREAPYVV